ERVQNLHAGLEGAEAEIRSLEQQRHQGEAAYTSVKVALGKVEERRDALAARQQRAEQDLRQRRADERRHQDHLDTAQARLRECQLTMLEASGNLAQAYLDEEAAAAGIESLRGVLEQVRLDRQKHQEQLQIAR